MSVLACDIGDNTRAYKARERGELEVAMAAQ